MFDEGETTPRRLRFWSAVAALMVLPVVAIRAIEATEWNLADAIFLALLFGAIALAYELAVRVSDRRALRPRRRLR